VRQDNARYLSSVLGRIPGIHPAKLYPGTTGNAWHLYMFRYDKEKFAGMPRAKFLKALSAEGVPASGGYSPLNKEPFLVNTLHSRGYQRIYSKEQIVRWEQSNQCPENDRLCEEAVWFTQNLMLTDHASMDQIGEAIARIQANAGDLARV